MMEDSWQTVSNKDPARPKKYTAPPNTHTPTVAAPQGDAESVPAGGTGGGGHFGGPHTTGMNKHSSGPANKMLRTLENETDVVSLPNVSMDAARLIQKGRQNLGLSQKELASKICEKPQVVNEYESGKAIPNNQIMLKLERALGMKLRGKDKGQPLAQQNAPKGKAGKK